MPTNTELLEWFMRQCEVNRRSLRIEVLVPNSDSCAYFVQEFNVSGTKEWENVGDGFTIQEALYNAMCEIGY